MDQFCFCGCTEGYLEARRDRKWSKRHLRWHVADWIPGVPRELQYKAYERAFLNWQRVCGLTFENSESKDNADFLILTRNIDGRGGTLAEHQLPYGNDAQLRGWFDVGDKWSAADPPAPRKIDLVAVACHEFGHGIGIGHLRQPNNLMNPFYNSEISTPQHVDIEEAVRRYGRSTEPPPEPELDYPVKVIIEMASGARYPAMVPRSDSLWG